ncbi:MAG TPA: hypothetical protein VGI95_22045 [Caulobacteraceae bacterium]|jgi:hypothetical protein
MADAAENFDVTKLHTADGSRAYALIQTAIDMHSPHVYRRAIYLTVDRNGRALLTGTLGGPTHLSASDVRPFEKAVAAAGFPAFPAAPKQICTDTLPTQFEAAVSGQVAHAQSNECGKFAPRVDRAIQFLMALANAHGGIAPFADGHNVNSSNR